MYLLIFIIVVILLILFVKLYHKFTCGICQSSAHMIGKVVIVTGGNSGIGFETAKDLAERGAKVILACRSVKNGSDARNEIVEKTGNDDVHYRQLDLASLRSVREFAKQILQTEKRIDVLINNAAGGGLGNHKTQDNLQVGMQVNYYAPFLLTCLLLPILKSSAPSRIINVSSIVYKYGVVDFENLNMEKYWSDYLVYANSKLYLNLMTLELSERLKGTGVTVNALHPGISATNIFRNIETNFIRNIVKITISFLFQTPREASQTSIYLAVSPDVKEVSGKYFEDCREKLPSTLSRDVAIAKRLWKETETLVEFSLPDEF